MTIPDVKYHKFTTTDELFSFLNENKRKHPIKTFIVQLYYTIVRFFEDIYRDSRAFIQRGKRGYANCDVWSFDYYLAKVMIGGLSNLKENHCGIPTDLADRYGDKADFVWNSIIDKIIDGFKAVIEWHDSDEYPSPESFKQQERRLQESLELLKTYYFSLWD